MDVNDMDVNDKSLRVVIALDFGTSRSGYAYAFINEKEPKLHFEWPAQAVPYEKTATHLLYTPTKDVESWGYSARQRLAQLRRDRKAKKYHFFQNFKMALHEKKTETWDRRPISIKNGQRIITVGTVEEFSIIDLVADYLRCIKEYALEDLRKQTAGILLDNEILWCLTVPAIWTNADKQMMREAAIKAGLISSDRNDTERLLLVLEPEAAAVHCLEKEASISSAMVPGTCFMVIDAGGGTIDITVHKVVESIGSKELVLDELTSGTGDTYGSTYVDTKFQEYLRNKITDKIWQDFHDYEPLAFLQLMAEWERQKCSFDYRQDIVTFISIVPPLYRILPESIHEKLNEEQGDDSYFELSRETMEALFQPALDGIVTKVEEQFRLLGRKKCDFIFLVGGFSSSPLLQKQISEKFGSRVKKIIVPSRPSAAVLLGAVSYGLDPSVIRARRSRLTYGIETMDDFNASIDPEEKKFESPQKGLRCKNRYSIFVKAGERVVIDRAIRRTFEPLYKDQKEMQLSCYVTKRKEARYIDEPGLFKIGEFTISRDDITSGYDWPVEVTMYFGKTEIKVEAKDLKAGKMENIEIKFSSTYFQEFITKMEEND